MNKTKQILKYLITDLLMSVISWTCFYSFRKIFIETQKFGYKIPLEFNTQFYKSLIFIPVFWVLLYALIGTYRNIYRRSRLREIGQTFVVTFFGAILLFFILVLDDAIGSYKFYYYSFFALFFFQYFLVIIPRLIYTTITVKAIHNRKIGYNTLLIGSNTKAVSLYEEMSAQRISSGNKFVGFVYVADFNGSNLESFIPKLGTFLKSIK